MDGAVVYHDEGALPVVFQVDAADPARLRQRGIDLYLGDAVQRDDVLPGLAVVRLQLYGG